MRAIAVVTFVGNCVLLATRLIVAFCRWGCGASKREQLREMAEVRSLVLREARPASASTDFSAYQQSLIFVYRITDRRGADLGSLKFWFNPQTRVFRRDLTFTNSVLAKVFGHSNVPLPPASLARGDTVAALRESTLQELERILQKREREKRLLRPITEPPVVPALPAPTPQRQVPLDAVGTPAQRQMPSGHAVEVKQAREQTAKVLSSDEGRLLGYGVAPRTLNNRDPKGPPTKRVDQFFVDLLPVAGAQAGAVKRKWGADLERALQEAKIELNTLVKVEHLCRVRVEARDDQDESWKNIYRVSRIGEHT